MLTITSSNKISNLGNIGIAGILRILFLIFLLSYFFTISTSFAFNNLPSCSYQDKPANPKHRENCYDVIDLPLCSAIKSNPNPVSSPTSSGNCVKECSDVKSSGVDIKTQPNIGHNYSCIRFCDNPESSDDPENPESKVNIVQGVNCVYRACHQLYDDKIPEIDLKGYYTNCHMIKCNLLSKDELNYTKFNTNNKWCDDKDVKCYQFGREKLPYIKLQNKYSMCEIHNCKPNSPKCGEDDTLNIYKRCSNPPQDKIVGDNKCKAGDNDQNYTDDYLKYVNANMPIDAGLCKPVMCKPLIKKDYACTSNSTDSTEVPNNPNPLCSTTCTNGYCSKIIDCNIENITGEERELCNSQLVTDESYSETNSWFYRPRLSDKFTNDPLGIPDKNKKMHNPICYTQDDLEANLGTSWFMEGSSPRRCLEEKVNGVETVTGIDWTTLGGRSWGYGGICGTGGNVYSKPDADAGYIDGYVKTNYELDNPQHTIRACLRFKNALALNACGKRECRIDSIPMFFAQTQWCGDDVCVDLTIDESDINKCSLTHNPDLFTTDGEDLNLSCLKMVDKGWGSGFGVGQMRLRAKKYGRRICAFLDMTGTFAFDAQYLAGTEKLDDNTCIEGKDDGNGDCIGLLDDTKDTKNRGTNHDPGLAHRWRTIIMPESTVIPYILNPGYYNLDGRFFYGQQCPLTPLRIGPPRFYNIATPNNSPTLFAPPLYILNAKVKRGGEISTPKSGEQYGETDFFEPEIEVKFGGTVTNINASKNTVIDQSTTKKSSQLLSLTTGQSNYDINNYDDSPSYAKLQTEIFGVKYTATVFVKKNYDENKKIGTFCLYRVFEDGKDIIEIQIGCVKRKDPEIYKQEVVGSTIKSIEKAVITSIDANNYLRARIGLKMMINFGSNKKDDNCKTTPEADDTCSISIELEQKKINKEECSYEIEEYKFCAKREECSQLYMECVENEVNLHNAKLANKPTGNLESFKLQCNTTILNNCNKKWGITSTKAKNIFEQTPPNPKTTNYYGWFNEICITNGFDRKLRRVLAYKLDNGATQGKCIIDPIETEKRNKNNPNFDIKECDRGGKATKDIICICKEVTDDTSIGDDQVIRFETPREAGLCIDIPIPKACPVINWTNNPYTIPSFLDPYHINDSINKNSYGANLVDYSHQFRTLKKFTGESQEKTHSEFDLAIEGEYVEGTCNGFWKPVADASGILRNPKMKCSDTGQWNYKDIENECIRYECPAITSSGIQTSGNYQNGYGNDETGEQKGTYHGFAYWPKYKKTNDFVENITATECIVGFKPRGGTLPTRGCNQLGAWGTPTNVCERIYCPAINMQQDGTTPISKSPETVQEWNNWKNNGGASFPSVAASRSKDFIRPESISTGICNNNIGVFQSPGGKPPTRECNYKGEWGPVKNPCVSTCDAISDAQGRSENNGFAIWPETNVEVGTDFKAITASECVSGYVINPYKKLLNDGTYKSLTDGAPFNQKPTRNCKSIITVNGIKANIWEAADNPCIDGCQGYDEDPTEGIGLTTLPSNNGTIQIKWTKTALGGDTYYQSPDSGCTILDASKFIPGRNNGCYRLKRHCNPDGRWNEPIAMCMANNGRIGFANYPGSNELLSTDSSTANKVIGKCIDGYRPTGGTEPIRKCSGSKIDGVALELSEGTSDCEEITCKATAPTTTTTKVCIVPFLGSCLQYADATTTNYTLKSSDGNAVYKGADKSVKIKEKLYLSCNNSIPQGPTPYAECNKDGKFDFFYSDSCKKNCSSPTPVIASTSVRVDTDKPGDGDNFILSEISTMEHGQVISFSAISDYLDSNIGDCNVWNFNAKCDNGEIKRYEDINEDLYDGAKCVYRIYDWTNNSWGPILRAEHDTQVIVHEPTGDTIFPDNKAAIGRYKDANGTIQEYIILRED